MLYRLVFTLFVLLASTLAHAIEVPPLEVSPNPFKPGQTVTIRWNFSGKKLVISGGTFGAGKVVTGKSSIKDKPKATTRYTVTATYPDPKSPKKLLTAKYTLVAEREEPLLLSIYTAKRGWKISYPRGWRDDHVNTPEEGRDGLIFFQKEEDALERLAVAIVPVKPGDTPATLWSKVRSDIPSRYDRAVFQEPYETSHYLNPAITTEFIGMDRSHPGKKTHTLMLIFIQEDRGYVVSVRTEEAKINGRRRVLDTLMRSLVPVLVKPRKPVEKPVEATSEKTSETNPEKSPEIIPEKTPETIPEVAPEKTPEIIPAKPPEPPVAREEEIKPEIKPETLPLPEKSPVDVAKVRLMLDLILTFALP